MQIIRLSAIASLLVLNISCASISDIENLQGQINSMKPEIIALSSNAAFAKVTAIQATSKAANAEAASNRSALYLQDVYAKLTGPVCKRPISN